MSIITKARVAAVTAVCGLATATTIFAGPANADVPGVCAIPGVNSVPGLCKVEVAAFPSEAECLTELKARGGYIEQNSVRMRLSCEAPPSGASLWSLDADPDAK